MKALPDNANVYLVGGAVRDALLGLPPGDNDFVVVGATVQQMLDAGYKQVGRDFPVFLHPATGEEHALARTERKSARGHAGFTVHADPSVTLEDDLRRRDFTINAIARDADGNLVDPFGGVRDIQSRTLRHVGEAFVEDPLRVLRAARFMARFAALGFTIAPGDDLIGFAALAHDLGKALTPEGELPRHVQHEQRGIAPVLALCERLRVPTEHRELAVIACREHLNVHRIAELKPATVHELIVRCDGFRKPARIAQLATVCEADARGRAGLGDSPYPQADTLRRLHAAAMSVRSADVAAGLEGPAVGEALRKARIAAIAAARGG